ncbi:histidine kinase [Geotalea uraniireducens]|uniref:histidine kinase n=2 Tax=Geotalea uraniireducens TaxID=351604 RepID=A0ABM8EM73_9BACT|nr:histidine kinase [Geotalea uraniireducens]
MTIVSTLKTQRNSFGLRFFLFFTVFIVIISISFTALFFQQQRKALKENIAGEGMLLTKLLAHNVRLGVFAEDEELLKDAVEGILQHEGVLFVSVFTTEGKPLREQTNLDFKNDRQYHFPTWQSRLPEIKKSTAPRVFEGRNIFEFWAPVFSSISYPSAESLFFIRNQPETQKIIGYVRIIVDKEPLNKKLDSLLMISVGMALAFLLLSTFISYFIVRRITRPLNRLTEGIQSLESGNSFEPVTVETHDEIGRLAQAFNHMAETIKKREAEKEHLAEELRHAQKMEAIGTLAGGVAHDFNNILTAIVGFGTLLQRSLKQDNPYQVYVDQILNAADRATNLVKRLLAFGRKQVINPRPTDLNEIIKSIEKLLARLISEDIDFEINLHDAPLICHVDSGQIDQILMNLVTNARDAMPDGGTLSIRTGRIVLDESYFGQVERSKPGNYATITVADTGMGMDEETKERVFDPFFTTKEVGKGTGLGLSMVYGIIKQHDGFVTVDSKHGTGTIFTICLPLVAGETSNDQQDIKVVGRGNRETILLAEDDKAVRKLTKHVLERNGYTVIESVDGADAVSLFQQNSSVIDLVLLDVVMPKKNGQLACEEMKKLRPAVKALFISGYTQDIISKKGVLKEGIKFISKPIKPDELLAKVQETLREK